MFQNIRIFMFSFVLLITFNSNYLSCMNSEEMVNNPSSLFMLQPGSNEYDNRVWLL